jgi:hypothetical protein
MAGAKGELHTVLRNPNDKSKSNTNLLTDEDFIGADSSAGKDRDLKDPGEMAKPPQAVVQAPPEPVTQIVADTTPVEPEPIVEGPKPWILEIYEGDTLRREEVFPPGVVPAEVNAAGATQNSLVPTDTAPAPSDAVATAAPPPEPTVNDPIPPKPAAPVSKPARDKPAQKPAKAKKTSPTNKTASKPPAPIRASAS